jgi:kynurenine formamidase
VRTLLDLSHPIGHGTITYPGLPAPVISDHLGFDESRGHYAPGTEFRIGRIEMVANTGTYLDTPAHRWRDGWDLAALPLERVLDVPGVLVDAGAQGPAIGPAAFAGLDLAGRAVLIRTGWSRHWGTDAYGAGGHPHLTAETAGTLVEAAPAVVGIDSLNIDATDTGDRPAHSALLAAGIPIVEHLTALESIPPGARFRFTALPPLLRGMGTFTVRAVAVVEG